MPWMSTRRLSAHELWASPNHPVLRSLDRLMDPQDWAHSLSTRRLHLRLFPHPSVEVLSMAPHPPLLDHLPQNDHLLVEVRRRSPRPLHYSSPALLHWQTVDHSPTIVGLCYRLCNLVHLSGPTLSLLLSLFFNDLPLGSAPSLVVHLHPCVGLNLYAISQKWTPA